MKTTARIAIILCSLLLILDSIGNPESVAKLLVVHSYSLVLPVLLFLGLIRWRTGTFLTKDQTKILTATSVGIIFFATLTILFDAITPPNTLYNLTRLNQVQLLLLGVFLFHVSLISQSANWWKKYWKTTLFLYPFFFFYLAQLIDLAPFNVFEQLVKEDNFIENLQFWVLAAGSVSCGYLSVKSKKPKKLRWFFFFAIFALGLGLVAGDEISWGQRLLGIETHENLKSLNRQQETTFHNLYSVEWLVIYGYLTLSAWGVFARSIIRKLAPNFFLIGYFLLPLIYFGLQLITLGGIWQSWSEVAELYLYAGIVWWLVLIPHSLKSKSQI